MQNTQQERKKTPSGDWLWFLAWGIFSTVWCFTASRHLSGTVDEWIYVERGLHCWRTFSHQGLLLLGTMPLPVDVETLPLFLWERLAHARFDPFTDLETPLRLARMGTLLFWWLLLIYARLIGRKLGGEWAGRLAVALIACEPNLLAHAALATTDISVSACLLAFCYHYQEGRDKALKQRVGPPILWFAALVLCKASGLVFGILCMTVIAAAPSMRKNTTARTLEEGKQARFLSFLRDCAWWKDTVWIVGLGTLLAFVYCGTDWLPYVGLVHRAQSLPPGTKRTLLTWLAEHLRLYANAADGVIRQIQHNRHGQGWYLLGHSGPHYVWWYFPVLLTLKLSLPLLLLPLLILIWRRRCLMNWAFLCALLQLLLSVTYHVQIGVRFLFPAICLGIVGLAAAITCVGERKLSALVGLGAVWTTISAVLWWPNGLAFTNGLWGNSHQGYLLVSDSNYDWGQGLKELQAWQQFHADKPLCLWYFGYDPAHYAFADIPPAAVEAHSVQEVRAALRGKYLAASATQVYGGYHSPQQPLVAYLRGMQPIARTTTFLIYDFTRSPP